MNQRGDCSLLGILIILAMSGLLTLTSLSLIKSFRRLKQRTNLILCLKEIKGEERQLYQFIGKTNWAIKNISKAKFLSTIIPGLQVGAIKAETLKKIVQRTQDLRIFSHMKNVIKLKSKNCPIPFEMRQSPFEFSLTGFKRSHEGLVVLREKKWNYHFYQKPYAIKMACRSEDFSSLRPKLTCKTSESVVTLLSPSF